ncbi:nitroreductase [Eggerthellaceae bacterium zg-893]|nr:nitroreductase [Eggerthellaceae bacterium zg-893]
MDLMEAIRARHSVRTYRDRPIEQDKRDDLQRLVNELNAESGLSMQLVFDDTDTFDERSACYGLFSGVRNYLALVGCKSFSLEEACGYFGEQVVLRAQQLGLNSCWALLADSRECPNVRVLPGEELVCVVVLGYGTTQGVPRQSKSPEDVIRIAGDHVVDIGVPQWFHDGVVAALLAPTAKNQQKFIFALDGKEVDAASLPGQHVRLDLGIAKLHFEIGAGTDSFDWAP